MAPFDDGLSRRLPRVQDPGWDGWDPEQARRGYTGHARALRDLEAGHLGGRPVLPVMGGTTTPAASGELGPAALALSARAATSDPLTVTYDQHEPGFAELYDALIVPQWSQPFGRLLLSSFLTLPRQAGWQVLDVGCGTGYPTLELARYLGQDCDITGIDSWEQAVMIAQRKANAEWLRTVSFRVGDIATEPLVEGSFDTITSNLGLASFADPAETLGTLRRLLRPGGHLLLTFPLQSAMREFLDTYHLTLRDLSLHDYMQALHQRVAALWTLERARQIVEEAGFEVRRTQTDKFELTFPDLRSFFTSPLIQTTYFTGWREIVPDLTIRQLVFNEVERRLQGRIQAAGGRLTMTVPMACLVASRR